MEKKKRSKAKRWTTAVCIREKGKWMQYYNITQSRIQVIQKKARGVVEYEEGVDHGGF